jgi:hypothetical protein
VTKGINVYDPQLLAEKEFMDEIEKRMLDLPENLKVDFPVEHFFGPQLYIRQMLGLKGHFAIGHEHLTEHVNIILTGSLIVFNGDSSFQINAPYMFNSPPGRKAAFFLEDTIWLNIHITDETDIDKIEDIFIKKSDAWMKKKEGES